MTAVKVFAMGLNCEGKSQKMYIFTAQQKSFGKFEFIFYPAHSYLSLSFASNKKPECPFAFTSA